MTNEIQIFREVQANGIDTEEKQQLTWGTDGNQ